MFGPSLNVLLLLEWYMIYHLSLLNFWFAYKLLHLDLQIRNCFRILNLHFYINDHWCYAHCLLLSMCGHTQWPSASSKEFYIFKKPQFPWCRPIWPIWGLGNVYWVLGKVHLPKFKITFDCFYIIISNLCFASQIMWWHWVQCPLQQGFSSLMWCVDLIYI
jgi:hypothetical protein